MMTFFLLDVNARDKDEEMYRYDVEGVAGSPTDNNKVLIKVWSYGKLQKITREVCMRNAIHGVLFKGVPATSSTGVFSGCEAIVPDGYDANKEYFDRFFESGEYLKYVVMVNHGNIQAGDRIKLSNNEYKIGMECAVNYKALATKLSDDGIAKNLDFLF